MKSIMKQLILAIFIADDILEHNPVVGVEFFKEPKRSVKFLSDEEAKRLIDACDTLAIKTFVVLGLNTGMRLNELLSLKFFIRKVVL